MLFSQQDFIPDLSTPETMIWIVAHLRCIFVWAENVVTFFKLKKEQGGNFSLDFV